MKLCRLHRFSVQRPLSAHTGWHKPTAWLPMRHVVTACFTTTDESPRHIPLLVHKDVLSPEVPGGGQCPQSSDHAREPSSASTVSAQNLHRATLRTRFRAAATDQDPLRTRKRFRRSPAECLTLYLSKETSQERQQFLSMLEENHLISCFALPTLLLRYLHSLSTVGDEPPELIDRHVNAIYDVQLESTPYNTDDLHTWASILSAPASDDRVLQFLAAASVKRLPRFLLLHIASCPDISPEVLEKLLVYCWSDVLEVPSEKFDALSRDPLLAKQTTLQGYKPIQNNIPLSIEHNAFTILISRLLSRVRETLPAALVSVAQMLVIYMDLSRKHAEHNTKHNKVIQTHQRVSALFNSAMIKLSLPARTNPMKNTRYNWNAQQVLLAAIDTYDQPLLIARSSYRAIALVLAATKKNHDEQTFAKLMRRAWPPFRRVLDGMDDARPRENDLSRVMRTNIMMRTVGYANNDIDEAITIIGGRTSNGSPTVVTRSFIKRIRALLTMSSVPSSGPLQNASVVAVAHVLATRDVREAWAAFVALPWDVKPSYQMYLAMFEKINSHNKHLAHPTNTSLPGDAKEVIAAFDDNLSQSEHERLQPPDLETLYRRMIAQGIKPSGRLLEFLVVHAPTFSFGARVLQDSDLPPRTISALLQHRRATEYKFIRAVPRRLLAAYIKLLGRLARAIPIKDDTTTEERIVTIGGQKYLTRSPRVNRAPKKPLLFALELLNVSGTTFRPAWYALFSRLTRADTVLSSEHFGTSYNAILNYQILKAALLDANKIGINLDAHGFSILCKGLERAIVASQVAGKEYPTVDLDADVQNLKQMFQKFTKTSDGPQALRLPKLLTSLEGAHLHAFIRVLCFKKDLAGVFEAVTYMKAQQDSIANEAMQSRNGSILLRRIHVCIAAFLDDLNTTDGKHNSRVHSKKRSSKAKKMQSRHQGQEELVLKIRGVMESLEGWEGWPTADEMQAYIQHDYRHAEVDSWD